MRVRCCCSPDNCRDNSCCYLLIFGIIVAVFGLIGMLCFTAGYINNKNFNEQQTLGICTVMSSFVSADRCSYQCNCDSNNKHCSTCYYTCYDGVAVVSIPYVTQGSPVTVVYYLQTANDVVWYLAINYPDGKSFGCYYNSNANMTGSVQVQLGLRDYMTSYYVGMVFCGIAATVLLIFLIFMAYAFIPLLFGCIGDACSGCCANIGRYMDHTQKRLEKQQRDMLKKMENGKLEESERSSSLTENDILRPPTYQDANPEVTPSAPPLSQSTWTAMTEN